jgi:hypothetical protein
MEQKKSLKLAHTEAYIIHLQQTLMERYMHRWTEGERLLCILAEREMNPDRKLTVKEMEMYPFLK